MYSVYRKVQHPVLSRHPFLDTKSEGKGEARGRSKDALRATSLFILGPVTDCFLPFSPLTGFIDQLLWKYLNIHHSVS